MKKQLPARQRIPGLEPNVELLGSLSPYLRHCGEGKRPAWVIEPRCLLDYLLVYVRSGRGVFTVGGQTAEARGGDLFWIPPAVVSRMEGFAPQMDLVYAHFDLVYRHPVSHWDFSIPGGMTNLAEFAALAHPPLAHPGLDALCGRIRSYNNARVGELLYALVREAYRAQPCAGLLMAGLLLQIVAELLRGRGGVEEGANEHVPQLEEAADYLRRNCAQEVAMAEMAEFCGLSTSRFRALFGQLFGCSPREYLRACRINLGKELMIANAELTFSEIAVQCGFGSIYAFSRAFREVEGITPGQYRRCGEPRVQVDWRKTPYSR